MDVVFFDTGETLGPTFSDKFHVSPSKMPPQLPISNIVCTHNACKDKQNESNDSDNKIEISMQYRVNVDMHWIARYSKIRHTILSIVESECTFFYFLLLLLLWDVCHTVVCFTESNYTRYKHTHTHTHVREPKQRRDCKSNHTSILNVRKCRKKGWLWSPPWSIEAEHIQMRPWTHIQTKTNDEQTSGRRRRQNEKLHNDKNYLRAILVEIYCKSGIIAITRLRCTS